MDLEAAHERSINHRTAVLASEQCGCFSCLALFAPDEIRAWVDEDGGVGQTALCPRCGIDSVIGSASGFELGPEFLARMKARWF